MFSKRRRAASNPPQRSAPPPSASASLAATKAFVRNQASDANLSNAAAAAALRSHTSSPTPVGELVTKRMVRRGSTSSQGSQRPQEGLRRQSSSGSMTERSFRNSSPGRGSPVVPPVPAVPQNIPGSGGSVHRRASSLEPVHRGGSPTQRGGGRGVSLDRGAGPSVNRIQRVGSPLAQVSEEGQDQRQSVNFSRPMSPGLTTTSGGPSSSHGWFGGPVVNQEAVQRMAATSRPKSAGNPSATYLNNTAQAVQNAANRPVSTHYVQSGHEGMRLSSGSMRAKPSGTAVQSRSFLPARTQSPRPVDPKSPDAVYDPSTRTFIHKADAMNIHREQHDYEQQHEEPAQQYVAQHLQSAAPVQAGRGRTPSPLRYSVQPEQSPPRSVAQPLLPKINTAGETQRFGERPKTPPSSQPSSGVTFARQASEDYANADIKPVDFIPIDIGQANTNQQPESEISPQFAQNQDSSYPRIGLTTTPQPTARVEQVRGSATQERQASLSPARHATFAPNTSVLAGLKHEPLPRSVSPAKSALKSSPSVSRRSNSPLGPTGRGYSKTASVSGASDTASESGFGKKKKTVRVSFEQEPAIAGHAAYEDMDTPVSPAGPTSNQPIAPSQPNDEFEDFMKPRPALPSFGSVRDKTRHRDEDDVPQKVTETVSTPMSASVASVGEPMEASTDLGLGHIVAQDFASKQTAASDPLPPQVTSVESSGYVSDSNYSTDGESSVRKHADPKTTSQPVPAPEPKSLTKPIVEQPSTLPAITEQVVQVPNISVLPATPSPYEHPEPKFQSMSVPESSTDEIGQKPTATTYAPIQFAPIETPASIQQQLNEPSSSPGHDGDSTDDDSSVYSDAYEDVSDMDGGFGSINAIVESPVVPSVAESSPGLMQSKWAEKSVTESPTPQSKGEVAKTQPADTSTSDWEAARAHWSGMNRPRDHADPPAVQTQAHAETVAARVLQAPVQEEELRTQRKSAVQPIPRVAESTPRVSMSEAPPRVSTSSQPSQTPNKPLKSALKKTTPSPAQAPASGVPQMRMSMRGASPRDASSGQTQMRTSMRGNASPGPRAAPQMRSSMRGDAAPSNNMALAASRLSAPADAKAPRGALQKRHIPAAVAASQARPQSLPAAAPKKTMAAPAPTYDSDSDASASSFQRSRARRNNGGGFARTSMRGGPAGPTMRASAPAPAPAQVRSISPPRMSQSNFRSSMRPSSPEPVKSSRFSIRSLSPAGRFRKKVKDEPPVPSLPSPKSMPKPKGKTPAPAKSNAFKSRFADSSDEDDDRPGRFRSRFADSDSEPEPYDLPPGLAPVRGIPRKAGEEDGDSTDLEEEIESARPSTSVANTGVTNGQTNGHTNGTPAAQGTALAAGSLRDSKHAPSSPATKEKRGFFGMGKKKKAPVTPTSVPAQPSQAPQPASATSDIPLPPQPRNREIGGPLTPIGEDDDKELGAPPNAVAASPQVKESPRSPKLQRRSTPDWPLAPPPPITGEQRPMSSDGVARRPRFGKRQSSQFSTATSPVLDAQGRSVSFGRTGKKKKFQGLRRVFGIND